MSSSGAPSAATAEDPKDGEFSATAWPRRSYAWYVATLLTVAYALAILDRGSIALLIQPLQASLDLSDTQFGYLQGMAFSLVYSVLGLPIGMISDRRNRVQILIAGLLLWSLATIACGLARNFAELFAARMLVGVGEAALVPIATSLLADYFPPSVRPKAYGLFVSGSAAGTGISFILSGFFLASAGYLVAHLPFLFGGMEHWQVVLALCGVPGLLLSLLMYMTLREPPRRRLPEPDGSDFSPAKLVALFRLQPLALGGLIGGVVLHLVCVYVIIGWFPALFIRVHGWSAPQTGYVLGSVMLPISLSAAIISGWVIAALARRGIEDAPVWVVATSALSMTVFATAASLAPSPTLTLIFYAINTCFVNWGISGFYSGIVQITPSELRGQVVAVQAIASALIAMTAGNLAVGFLSDNVFPTATGVASAMALVFVLCGGSACVLLLCSRGAFRHAAEAQRASQG